MAYDTDELVEGGLAAYIKKYAERKKSRWAEQDRRDQIVLALELLDNSINIATRKGAAPHPLHFGIWKQLVNRDAAVLTVEAFIHFNEPDPLNPGDKLHSSLLEGFINSAIKKSRATPSMIEMQRRDLIGKGRYWEFDCHIPEIWADEEIEALVEKKKNESDLAKKDVIDTEIEAYKRDNWPIQIRYVNPVGTYSDFGGKRWLPEVVECRKMTCDAIKDAYDHSCGCNEGVAKDHDVYAYGNWKCVATIVCGDEAKTVNYWEHHLKKNPYTLAETNVTESDRGFRWEPQLAHAQGLIKELDKLISDRSTNAHNTALGHTMQMFKRDEYPEEMVKMGRPEVVVMEPGGTTAWFDDMLPIQAPLPTLTPAHDEHFRFVYEAVMRHALYPIEQGETKSGDTGVSITTSYQIAQRRFSPALAAIVAQQEDAARTIMRIPAALNYAYPGRPDKLTIFDQYKGQGALSVTPKDMLGWENALQAIIEPAIPVDRNRQIANAEGISRLGMSRQTIYEESGIEDPEAEIRTADLQMVKDAVIQRVAIPTAIQLFTFKLKQPTPEAQGQIASLMPDATPQLQDILKGMGMDTGATSQGLASTRRANLPQDQSGREAGLDAG